MRVTIRRDTCKLEDSLAGDTGFTMRVATRKDTSKLEDSPGGGTGFVGSLIKGTGIIVLVFLLMVIFPFSARGNELIDVNVTGEPVLPEPVKQELVGIFTHTLTAVIFDSEEGEELIDADPVQLAEGIRTGINIVIEPIGYTVAELELDFTKSPVTADFLVHPAGWTHDDPHAVTDVIVVLSPHGLAEFWQDRLGNRLAANENQLKDAYREILVGMPAHAVNSDWALGLIAEYLDLSDPAPGLFPDFKVSRAIELGPVATVEIALEPGGDVIEWIRPRMYSLTLYNVILDRFRERLIAEADFIEGMPRSEIDAAADDIAAELAASLKDNELARRLRACVSISVETLPDQPVVQIDSIVESRSFDLWCEAFVDFGNESRDSAEVQSRFGIIITRGVEVFLNFNYFTNDSTLETDAAIGFRPSREIFAAVGYDFEREATKYFLESAFSPGFKLRGEFFEDDTLNEYGMVYQFQQYLSAGIFTNGDNEYWVRGIFTL